MEVKQINQLMLAMGRTGVKKLVFKKDGVELQLEREERAPLRNFEGVIDAMDESPIRNEIERQRFTGIVTSEESDTKTTVSKVPVQDEKDDAISLFITSPMVGTFYHAPSPNEPAFVKVGDRVEEKKTVVCVIEAMKVMNEIKATVSGVITAVLVENGHPVEFGTKLFRISPAA